MQFQMFRRPALLLHSFNINQHNWGRAQEGLTLPLSIYVAKGKLHS